MTKTGTKLVNGYQFGTELQCQKLVDIVKQQRQQHPTKIEKFILILFGI
ncbi:unnamed protein product (macronuclear) [Paramecium tetraurelia]|uniref:Uncharacterized protein n=1 Tax=Paramecium tetraurelia TaxID=5888 RepID=A0DFV5_PARTE|nr:uncharacterized protein GSPATT00039484001 [Paramecium tetraurelia]CAK81922.1 unnamed protein product [Paramecium tetraurelia]|eukprot:XP_001449319.1 hypothetical protein (macronuclear) [Paramecium tetraurelia strain d4-2]